MNFATLNQITLTFLTLQNHRPIITPVIPLPGVTLSFCCCDPKNSSTQEEIDKPIVPSQERVAPRGEETILIVEDEESLRSVTQKFLSDKGYQVIVAEDFQKALEASENNPRHIDLLMTDVVLQGSIGPKLADRLATSHPEMKVLFVSGYTADALVHGGLHRTDFAFLSKPFSLNTLVRTIRMTWTRSSRDPETGIRYCATLPRSNVCPHHASGLGSYSW